jgi:hypothetical protein
MISISGLKVLQSLGNGPLHPDELQVALQARQVLSVLSSHYISGQDSLKSPQPLLVQVNKS